MVVALLWSIPVKRLTGITIAVSHIDHAYIPYLRWYNQRYQSLHCCVFFIDVNLLFSKQSLQTHFVRSCRDIYVFYAMYWGLYGDIKSFRLLIFVWIKMANYTKTLKTSFWQNERWQKHKRTWFNFVYPFALRNRYWFKTFFRKKGTIFEVCDFKNGGLLYISRCSSPTIGHNGLILVLYARQITILSEFIIAGWFFLWKRRNYHFRKSCVSFACKYIFPCWRSSYPALSFRFRSWQCGVVGGDQRKDYVTFRNILTYKCIFCIQNSWARMD